MSKRTKIAPELSEILAEASTDPRWGTARAELRALLAVARAAKADIAVLARHMSLPSWRSLADDSGSTSKLVRALANLDKASRHGVGTGR